MSSVVYALIAVVTFLAQVEDTFSITGRGLVLVPAEFAEDFRIRVGTPIQLRTPAGHLINTRITGVELLKMKPPTPCRMAIMVTGDVARESVPSGTEIWYLREDDPEYRQSTAPPRHPSQIRVLN